MRYRFFVFAILIGAIVQAQITCDQLKNTSLVYNATAFKHGKAKLMATDTAITNRMQQKTFELKKVSDLSSSEKEEIAKYNIKFNETDTVMFYDWDILHNGKVGYFGRAVAKVKITCADSMIYTYKYLLNKETVKYVPNQFKIIRMTPTEFIINDRIHPYMNINYYFKK